MKNRRGFSLLIVMIAMALLAVVGTVVLSIVTNDERITGVERNAKEARFEAESGGMEILNDDDLPTMLPSYASGLTSKYQNSANGAYTYEGTIKLVRDTPIRESSLSVTRAFLYEVEVESSVDYDNARDEVNVEIFKVFTLPSGTVLPDSHAR